MKSMTKNEFIAILTEELGKKNIADADDIIEEYRQHFDFKLADGYSEEEISAKLGDPAALAAQFVQSGETQKKRRGEKKPFTVAGVCLAWIFAGAFFVLLALWGIVMVAFSLACAAAAVCLIGGFSINPPMPYWCGAALALALAALGVLSAVGSIYYAAFLRQLVRSFARFSHNALATASGKAPLPSLAINPQINVKTKRRMRSVALISLAMFASCLVLAYIACSLSAGSVQFWHVWGWFGYNA